MDYTSSSAGEYTCGLDSRVFIIIIIISVIINEHFNVHTVNLINVMLNYTYK